MRITPLAATLALLPCAAAADGTHLEQVVVSATPLPDELAVQRTASGDTTSLLRGTPGFSAYANGGISSLPVLRGLADDRVKVRIDGMEITSACANHMNAPLSYIAPTQVGRIQATAGITPVSAGGDSIAGTIEVESAPPAYAAAGATELRKAGAAFLASRDNGRGFGAALRASLASESLSLGWEGSIDHAESYQDGRGDKVLDTLYRAVRQSLTAAARGSGNEVVLHLARQSVPYQGFPNQYMDMESNDVQSANLGYTGDFRWGRLKARFYWQHTEHDMGFFSDEKPGMMPMETWGRDLGYTVQAELPLAPAHTLRLGHEYHRTALDDKWPPVAGSMMMGPQTYININDGQRTRLALYGEWETRWSEPWATEFGLRGEKVRSDAGAVQPYNPMPGMMNPDAAAAAAFNAQDRTRSDDNVDFTATARYSPDEVQRHEIGYARKSRSPNLYERYAWGRGTMAMTMIGWFGDGNGYVGDPDLKPEVAHVVSATAGWQQPGGEGWSLRITPHMSYVDNYIDADPIGIFHPYMRMGQTRALLQFANHDARLYGVDVDWRLPLWDTPTAGQGTFKGNLAWLRGRRTDGGNLYHIMPPNTVLALEHVQNAWRNQVELELVSGKSRVDERRFEPATGGYGLVHLDSTYRWSPAVSFTVGVRNLFDKDYDLPLGGVNLAAYRAGGSSLDPLAGPGRSINAGMKLDF